MRRFLLAALLLAPGLADAGSRLHRHEPMSGTPMPWDFAARSPSTVLSLREQRLRDCGCAGRGGAAASASAAAASSTHSYAIGNWTQISMALGSNANGMINTEDHQNNWGNGTATMNVDSQNAGGDQDIGNGASWDGTFGNNTVGQ